LAFVQKFQYLIPDKINQKYLRPPHKFPTKNIGNDQIRDDTVTFALKQSARISVLRLTVTTAPADGCGPFRALKFRHSDKTGCVSLKGQVTRSVPAESLIALADKAMAV